MISRALASLVVVLSCAACATEDIVVATLAPDAGTDGQPPCKTNDDCPPMHFCAMMECRDTTGQCEDIPLICMDISYAPRCGCDGITYWNDCLRKQNGERAVSVSDVCVDGAVTCNDPSKDCNAPFASCARLQRPTKPGERCDPQPLGTCWVLPDMCPDTAGEPMENWGSCMDPMTCADTCTAIRSGDPHQAVRGPGCPAAN